MVTVTLDKERHLKYSMFALKQFSKATGKRIQAGMKESAFNEDDILAFIWACLAHEDSAFTLDDFLKLVDNTNLPPLLEAFQALMKEQEIGADPLAQTSG